MAFVASLTVAARGQASKRSGFLGAPVRGSAGRQPRSAVHAGAAVCEARPSSGARPAGPRKPKVLAIDMDGTLFNSKHEVSERNREALERAMESGVKVVFATGKTRASTRPLTRRMGLSSLPGVFLQGLVVYGPDEELHYERVLPDEVSERIIHMVEHRHTLVAYSNDHILTRKPNDYSYILAKFREPEPISVCSMDIRPGRQRFQRALAPAPPPHGVSLYDAVPHLPFHKMLVLDEPDAISRLRVEMEEAMEGHATCVQAMDNMLEILPLGASKGDGVERLIDLLGHSWDEVMALGDAENDLEMLERAGLGVAMGNAKDSIKARANAVTGTNDEDGVAQAIEEYILSFRD
eukprot:tig00000391_g24859.t1